MENNPGEQKQEPNAVPPTPSVEAPVQPAVPQVPVAEASGESKKMVLWLIIGLVVIIALVGGIYFFLSRQNTVNQPKVITQASPAPEENLEEEIQSLDIESGVDEEFDAIDQDLNQL